MGRSPEERLTAETAREICRRQGLKAMVSGAIAPLGSHYVITLEASDHNGEVVAREQIEAESKEQVLRALARAADRLRERLGESLGSIERFKGELTTSSLEALKANTQGRELTSRGKWREAIQLLQARHGVGPELRDGVSGTGSESPQSQATKTGGRVYGEGIRVAGQGERMGAAAHHSSLLPDGDRRNRQVNRNAESA